MVSVSSVTQNIVPGHRNKKKVVINYTSLGFVILFWFLIGTLSRHFTGDEPYVMMKDGGNLRAAGEAKVENQAVQTQAPIQSPIKSPIQSPIQSPPAAGPKTREWPNWPAVAYEEVGKPLVTKGESFFNDARKLYFKTQPDGKTLIDEFVEVYKNRPDPVNMCGIRINHAMALFLAVRQIQPTLVIESGVNAGVSTYFIRAASPTTKIFALDPLPKPICNQGVRWIDPSSKTINYTGNNFVDLMDLDWKGMVERKEIDPESTLVFLDDHLHAFKRIAGVMKFGVRHIVVEDNYKIYEGATPNDQRSTPKQMFFGEKWKKEGDWLFNNLVAYAEFPPIIPPIMSNSITPRKKAGGFMHKSDENKDIVHPILRPDLSEADMRVYQDIAGRLGIDPSLKEDSDYMQFMNYNQICHLELLPMPPTLLYE